MQPPEMRRDAELLGEILSDGDIVVDRVTGRAVVLTAKQVALWTGLSVKTISAYRTGNLNIPVDFWRRILAHHIDHRIVALIAPLNAEIECVPVQDVGTAPEFFKKTIESEIAFHERQRMIAEVLSDGRIDELDSDTVREYDRMYLHHRMLDAALHRSVLAAFNARDTARSAT